MLLVKVPIGPEEWDEENEVFIEPPTVTLELEHSLVSIYAWESKWHKPFFSKSEKTAEETLDYIMCMTLNENIDPEVYTHLTNKNIADINIYIENPMTATTFREEKDNKSSKETVTAELVYYWMFSLNIPIEWEKRHINQLLTLVRVFNVKNAPAKKTSQKDAIARNKAINARNRALLESKGR